MHVQKSTIGILTVIVAVLAVFVVSGNLISRAGMVDQPCGLLWLPSNCIFKVGCDCVNHQCTPWKDPNSRAWSYYPGTGYRIESDWDWCYREKGCQPFASLRCNSAANCVDTSIVLDEYLDEGFRYVQPLTSCSG